MALMTTLMTGRAYADRNEEALYYMVMQAGMDQLRIEMPIYDSQGYDGWIDDGNVYVTVDGGIRQTLLHYSSDETDSDSNCFAWLRKGVDGTMMLSRDQGYSDVAISSAEQKVEIPFQNGGTLAKLYITWTVPASMRGRGMTISWYIHKTGNGPAGPAGEANTDIKIDPTKVFFTAVPDEVKPTVMDPILGFDVQHAGQMMLICNMPTNDIRRLTAHYTEVQGSQQTQHSLPVEPEMSGFLYLDASKCYKNFYLEARYLDTEKALRSSCSDAVTLPTLRQPGELTAAMQPDGMVLLTWKTRNNDWHDIMPTDVWEVQRNTTGALNASAQWVTINQVDYLSADTLFSCYDPSLISSYEGQPVYYRVRRASTSFWDWREGTYAQTWARPR